MKKALGVPVELLQICTRAAAKRVEDRYASALEMRDALRAYIRTNNLEFSAEQMRGVLGDLYANERVEIRRLVDQRMKQANLEDDHPSFGTQVIPVAPAVLGGIGGATLTGNASTYVLPPSATSKGKWVAALVGVAALAGVAGRWLSSDRPQQPVEAGLASTPAAQVANGAPQSAAVASKLVTVKIAASPTDTEILLDGARLEGNPFIGQFAKDASLHRLELRSVGRITEARMIRLDQDLDLLIPLAIDKANPLKARAAAAPAFVGRPAAARAAEPATPAAPVAAAPGAPLPPVTHREMPAPARPIDDSDPYAK
jgi:hypothetical protein